MSNSEEEIRRLKEMIRMCRSHQNESNYYLIEDQITSIILRIMELEGVTIVPQGEKDEEES